MDIDPVEALHTLRVMTFNAIWILGASIDLAVVSYVIYELRLGHPSLACLLEKTDYRRWLLAGTLLLMLGAALTANSGWQTGLYSLLALGLIVRLSMDIRNRVDHYEH